MTSFTVSRPTFPITWKSGTDSWNHLLSPLITILELQIFKSNKKMFVEKKTHHHDHFFHHHHNPNHRYHHHHYSFSAPWCQPSSKYFRMKKTHYNQNHHHYYHPHHHHHRHNHYSYSFSSPPSDVNCVWGSLGGCSATFLPLDWSHFNKKMTSSS